MGVTRRELFKGAFTAAALALVPSLPGLPKAAQEGRWWGRVVALPAPDPQLAEYSYSGPGPLFNGSHMKLDNYGISSVLVRQRMEELQGLPPLCAFWPMPEMDNYGIADDESAIWPLVVAYKRGKCEK